MTDALDVVAEKAQDVQEAQVGTRGFKGQLDESLKETKKEAEKLTTATKALTTATKDLATESKTAATGELELSREMREAGQAADVRTIKLRQSAVSIGQISQALGPAISGLKNFAIESKNSDLENLATGFQSLNGAVGLAAQGFAVGGPLGAAVAASDRPQSRAGVASHREVSKRGFMEIQLSEVRNDIGKGRR